MHESILALLIFWSAELSRNLEAAYLAANIYHEARGESIEGQRVVAYVTVARARDNNPQFGGPSIRSVVFHWNMREDCRWTAEFSWCENPTPPTDHEAISTSWNVAKNILDGTMRIPAHLQDVRFYKNTKTAGAGGSCWFDRNTVYVATVGNHDFYRPHRNLREWKQGQSKQCYAEKPKVCKPTFVARLPKPRPVREARLKTALK